MKTRKSISRSSLIAIIILLFMVSDCAISPKFKTAFYHDKENPCLQGEYRDPLACDYWRTHHPKEYQRFLNRLDSIK